MGNIKLKFVHVSENAFFSKDNKLSIIGIFDKIFSNNFPALHPAFAISIGMTGKKGIYKIAIEIISPPQKQSIVVVEKDIEIKQDNGSANFVANIVNLQLPNEGKYIIKIKLDDEIIDENNYIIVEKVNEQ